MPTTTAADDAPRTITVPGMGRVQVPPDLVDLRLGVIVTAASVAAARTEAGAAMTKVVAALKSSGVAERDLQTSVVAVSPAYDYSSNENPPRITGYTISNLVAATVRDVTKLGDAIDGALEAGATSIDRLAFGLSNQAEVEQEARAAAVADARARADTLAQAAGVSIAGVAAVVEAAGSIPYPAQLAEMKSLAARDAATPVEAGVNEVEISVVVTYLLG